ncbi:MAG: sulfur carrier protein ThiS [Planctomycetes bacterium]|nr:sulfur carrier protein ThiS [Planctomycetota bacterium]
MRVTVNGEKMVFEYASLTVAKTLDLLNIAGETGIAVELNGVIVRAEDRAKTVLKDGDALEIVSFVGGG